MTPKTLSALGILFLVAAVAVSILNLKRVADLGMVWLSPVLLIVGIGLMAASRRRG
jgi:hypothetical protein